MSWIVIHPEWSGAPKGKAHWKRIKMGKSWQSGRKSTNIADIWPKHWTQETEEDSFTIDIFEWQQSGCNEMDEGCAGLPKRLWVASWTTESWRNYKSRSIDLAQIHIRSLVLQQLSVEMHEVKSTKLEALESIEMSNNGIIDHPERSVRFLWWNHGSVLDDPKKGHNDHQDTESWFTWCDLVMMELIC
jgi:hypothetical protein